MPEGHTLHRDRVAQLWEVLRGMMAPAVEDGRIVTVDVPGTG